MAAHSSSANAPSPRPVERSETHYEWLARMLIDQDRRVEPFQYRHNPPQSERRRWDALASFSAQRTGASDVE